MRLTGSTQVHCFLMLETLTPLLVLSAQRTHKQDSQFHLDTKTDTNLTPGGDGVPMDVLPPPTSSSSSASSSSVTKSSMFSRKEDKESHQGHNLFRSVPRETKF